MQGMLGHHASLRPGPPERVVLPAAVLAPVGLHVCTRRRPAPGQLREPEAGRRPDQKARRLLELRRPGLRGGPDGGPDDRAAGQVRNEGRGVHPQRPGGPLAERLLRRNDVQLCGMALLPPVLDVRLKKNDTKNQFLFGFFLVAKI